jgi:hypothetical protein
MIKYATKNKDDQLEQHLKIVNFNHDFNITPYMEKKREQERIAKMDEKKENKEGKKDK